jgi:hypothetical protein
MMTGIISVPCALSSCFLAAVLASNEADLLPFVDIKMYSNSIQNAGCPCFKSFHILLHTLLGSLHPLVQGWDNFVSMWIEREACLSKNLDMHQFVAVLRWMQIGFSTWFMDQHCEPGCAHISARELPERSHNRLGFMGAL